MRVAAAAWPLDPLPDFDAFAAKVRTWIAEAAGQGADLAVLPEYGALELAHLDGPAAAGDLEACLAATARHMPAALELWTDLARREDIHILAPSAPAFDPGTRPVNRAHLIGPGGPIGHQDKQVMTRFEREEWDVRPGGPLRLFDTALGPVGVLICYDAEFPLLGRALVEAGAEILLVPSCTDGAAGFARVRIGAMARALEGQCAVVHAVTQGDAPWLPAADRNVGRAGVYGPPDAGFPPTGLLAQGAPDRPGWTFARIDRAAIARVRAAGEVLNRAHWPESAARARTDLP